MQDALSGFFHSAWLSWDSSMLRVCFLYWWVVFCCMDTPPFVSPFVRWWIFGLIPGLGSYGWSSHECLWAHTFIFLGEIGASGMARSSGRYMFNLIKKTFSKVVVPISTRSRHAQGFRRSASLQTSGIIVLFHFSYPSLGMCVFLNYNFIFMCLKTP